MRDRYITMFLIGTTELSVCFYSTNLSVLNYLDETWYITIG